MYILGIHLVDLIVYVLGEPNKITSFLKHTNLANIDFEDNNLAVSEYEKALARVYVSSRFGGGTSHRYEIYVKEKLDGKCNLYSLDENCRFAQYTLRALCDLANLVELLTSYKARFITGQTYVCDGGRTLSMKGTD